MVRGRAACLLLLSVLHAVHSRPRELVTSGNTAGITQPMKQGDIAINNDYSALQCADNTCYWPKSSSGAVHVPYIISPSYTDRHLALIREALEEFNTLTCIKLVNRTTETDYLSITSENGCWSYIGKIGGGQTVSLAESTCMSKGIIHHEVDHALGFYHEHTRSDRDEYVDIQLHNIAEGNKENFEKQETNNLDLPYDFQSVLHYGRYAYSKTPGLPSIIPKPDPNIEIGQRYGLSPLDVAKLNRLYSCDLCSTLLSSANGSLASANHPENYANNASCLWLIRIQRQQVALQFDAFDLQDSPDCTSDYVTVYDGASRASPKLLHRACGSDPLPLLVASGTGMLVEFVSDGAVTRSGFNASYGSVECGGSFTRDNGVITSPGFPEAYPNSVDCVWSILAPVGQQIQLEFTSFDVERFPDCGCDYLVVKDGGTTNSPLLGKYCGNSPLQPIVSTGNMLLLQFSSDVWVNKPGFSIVYSFIQHFKKDQERSLS
ncbi:astacin-like metalloendopeptidase isoform X2 [Pleurodeles waltl]|uniref:astacin-like metalloendopeptidase isoform X2 n=1 Tax=Pleurodeles waltl TaxID=8319 RepID=UPI0037094B06